MCLFLDQNTPHCPEKCCHHNHLQTEKNVVLFFSVFKWYIQTISNICLFRGERFMLCLHASLYQAHKCAGGAWSRRERCVCVSWTMWKSSCLFPHYIAPRCSTDSSRRTRPSRIYSCPGHTHLNTNRSHDSPQVNVRDFEWINERTDFLL